MRIFTTICLTICIVANFITLYNMNKTDKKLKQARESIEKLYYVKHEIKKDTTFTLCKNGCDFDNIEIAETVLNGKLARRELTGKVSLIIKDLLNE